MKILAIGDIVGDSGVGIIANNLRQIKKDLEIDFVIANGENAASGMGLYEKQYNCLLASGVDCVTMGNHTWAKKDIFSFIDHNNIIRPANYPEEIIGKGYNIFECHHKKICVINLLGRVSMNVLTDNPFIKVEQILNTVENKCDIIIVDFHAEATAEKKAMSYFLDGRATIVFGTHTHIQTSDEQILEKRLAYITDLGMTGPKNAVIGMDVFTSLKRFKTSLPEKYKISNSEPMLNSCLFEIDDNTDKVVNIKRYNIN